MNYNIIDNVV